MVWFVKDKLFFFLEMSMGFNDFIIQFECIDYFFLRSGLVNKFLL